MGQKKKSGSTSSRAQIAHRAPDRRLSAPSRGMRPVGPKDEDPLPKPVPGVIDDGGERLLGALAAGVPPPDIELPVKMHCPELGSVVVVVAVPLKLQEAPVAAFFW